MYSKDGCSKVVLELISLLIKFPSKAFLSFSFAKVDKGLIDKKFKKIYRIMQDNLEKFLNKVRLTNNIKLTNNYELFLEYLNKILTNH